MFRDTLLGLGLALYPATQLRLDGVPLGMGEVFLNAWLALSVAVQLTRGSHPGNTALWHVVTFWSVIALAESIGLVSGLATELFQDVMAMLHDVFAYSLMLALGTMLSLELAGSRRRRRVCWLVTGLSTVVLVAQLIGGFVVQPLSGVNVWFFDRFCGWSNDANQLGFVAAFLTVTSLYLAQTASSITHTAAALVCTAVAFLVGILTKSDSFVVSLLVGASIWVMLTAFIWIRTLEMGPTLRGAAVLFGLLGVPLMAAAFAPFASAAMERIEGRSEAVYEADGQGDTRLELWTEAIERGVHSGFIGLGPGPQLTSKSYKRPPPSKFESHNTPLELFSQGGLLAIGVFIWLCLSALRGAWRARLPGMAALMCTFVTFCMFHFLARHPIFWFGVIFCLLESAHAMEMVGPRARLRGLMP